MRAKSTGAYVDPRQEIEVVELRELQRHRKKLSNKNFERMDLQVGLIVLIVFVSLFAIWLVFYFIPVGLWFSAWCRA